MPKQGQNRVATEAPRLIQWALLLEAPLKQVMIQVLSGTPEHECAKNLSLTTRQVKEMLKGVAEEGPHFYEDRFAMAARVAKDCAEFCRTTGQTEGVYKFLLLRYPKRARSGASLARCGCVEQSLVSDVLDHSPMGCDDEKHAAQQNVEMSRKRRHERMVARERARAMRMGALDAEESALQSSAKALNEPEERPVKALPRLSQRVQFATVDHANAVLEMVNSACERCVAESVRPIAFVQFMFAFRRECNARGWTSELIPLDGQLRRILEADDRVLWVGLDAFWFFDWREHTSRLRCAIEGVSVVGKECSTRYYYRQLRPLMRALQIKAPDELYEILRRVYSNAADRAAFGSDLSFGFGPIDRQRQVRSYVNEHPGEPKNILAMGYEREYGFSAGTAEIWIDLFAEVKDVSVSEWVCKGSETVAHSEASQSRNETMRTERQASAVEPAPKLGVAEEMPPSVISPSPEVSGISLEAFLARELKNPICDAGLIRRRFEYEFPSLSDITKNETALSKAGYYENHGLLFRLGLNPTEHFSHLLASRPSFSRGDSGFEAEVWRHPMFRHVLNKNLKNHQILLYETDSYISFSRLNGVLGIKMSDIEAYASMVSAAVPVGKPFTVSSLRNNPNMRFPLDDLDLPLMFYEGLLDTSEMLDGCTLAGTKVFVVGWDGRFSADDFIEWIVSENEGIEREEVPLMLRKQFGIDVPMTTLVTTAHNSNVYHDDVGDAYYSSMEAWKQEVRNEFAQ